VPFSSSSSYLHQQLPDLSEDFWDFFEKYGYHTILFSNNPDVSLLSLDDGGVRSSRSSSSSSSSNTHESASLTETDMISDEDLFDWWPPAASGMAEYDEPSDAAAAAAVKDSFFDTDLVSSSKKLYEAQGFLKTVIMCTLLFIFHLSLQC
jgi:hypothetical protein